MPCSFIEVDKLTKRSFQYNMEFLQFIKCYWDMARSQPPTPCNALRGLRFPLRSQHAPDGVAPDAVFHESAGNEQAHIKQQPPARKAPPAGAKTAPGIGSAKRVTNAPAQPPPPPPPPTQPPPSVSEQQGVSANHLSSLCMLQLAFMALRLHASIPVIEEKTTHAPS